MALIRATSGSSGSGGSHKITPETNELYAVSGFSNAAIWNAATQVGVTKSYSSLTSPIFDVSSFSTVKMAYISSFNYDGSNRGTFGYIKDTTEVALNNYTTNWTSITIDVSAVNEFAVLGKANGVGNFGAMINVALSFS